MKKRLLVLGLAFTMLAATACGTSSDDGNKTSKVDKTVTATSNSTKTTAHQAVTIALANVADCDTTISIGDVYNQLLLTAKVENIESVIESPV